MLSEGNISHVELLMAINDLKELWDHLRFYYRDTVT